MVTDAFAKLVAAFTSFHEVARKGDKDTDPTLNDPAPYVLVSVLKNDVELPLYSLTLTRWHAESLAAGLAGSMGGSASDDAMSMASWTRSNWWRPADLADGRVEFRSPSEDTAHAVTLNEETAVEMARVVDAVATWVAGEQFLLNSEAPVHHKDAVRVRDHVPDRAGQTGIAARVRLAEISDDNKPSFDVAVRMDYNQRMLPLTFKAEDLEPNEGQWSKR